MEDIQKLPLQELLDDRRASLDDIVGCKLALAANIEEYSGGKLSKRVEGNEGIVAVIEKELRRRKVCKHCGSPMTKAMSWQGWHTSSTPDKEDR